MKKIIPAGFLLAFLVSCSPSNPTLPPEVISYRTPVDANTGIRHQRYKSVTRGYRKRSVVEPEQWEKQNTEPTSWREYNVDPVSVEEPPQ